MELQKGNMAILNYNKLLISALILFFISTDLFSQARDFNAPSRTKPKPEKGFKFDPSNLVVGGNLGASFGNITYVEIAPTIGYLFSPKYLAGLSGRYIYFEDQTFAPIYTYKTNIYGGGVYNQYFFLENFLAHAEYELLNLDSPIKRNTRINVQSVFLGGGYRSSFGGASYVSILLLYNLNETPESPYSNPLLRIGFGIGL